jgi:hypothetical protein
VTPTHHIAASDATDRPGRLKEISAGQYVGWVVGSLVSVGRMDDYGVTMLSAQQTNADDSDPEELRDSLSRTALLALLAPWIWSRLIFNLPAATCRAPLANP